MKGILCIVQRVPRIVVQINLPVLRDQGACISSPHTIPRSPCGRREIPGAQKHALHSSNVISDLADLVFGFRLA